MGYKGGSRIWIDVADLCCGEDWSVGNVVKRVSFMRVASNLSYLNVPMGAPMGQLSAIICFISFCRL